jgi:hypothetical protein
MMKTLVFCHLRELPSISRPTFAPLSSAIDRTTAVCFDSDSYLVGIIIHALRCMVNASHLFEDLNLGDVGEVEGIESGLDIKGMGTFKFRVKDDNSMTRKIKIPSSLYIPKLRMCLLSPQHWVQKVKGNYPRPKKTMMDQDAECYYLNWGQAKYRKSVPYAPSTNVPILYTTASLDAYCVFAATFKALKAPFF